MQEKKNDAIIKRSVIGFVPSHTFVKSYFLILSEKSIFMINILFPESCKK